MLILLLWYSQGCAVHTFHSKSIGKQTVLDNSTKLANLQNMLFIKQKEKTNKTRKSKSPKSPRLPSWWGGWGGKWLTFADRVLSCCIISSSFSVSSCFSFSVRSVSSWWFFSASCDTNTHTRCYNNMAYKLIVTLLHSHNNTEYISLLPCTPSCLTHTHTHNVMTILNTNSRWHTITMSQ